MLAQINRNFLKLIPHAIRCSTRSNVSYRLRVNGITPTASFGAKHYHSIIRESEKPKGETNKHEFKAETKMLLDIVAKSLYSENEVFVRELISNASDAIEKFRYIANTSEPDQIVELDRKCEIHIETNKQDMKLVIQDRGIGMTKDELIDSLGTIAKSGSKNFLSQLKDSGSIDATNIIGQFGVGFYSVFMCASHVDVYTKSSSPGAIGYKWSSEGTGSFEIQECDDVDVGTKIVIQLKPECREYADEDRIRNVVKKYSNFVGSPIFLNGNQLNLVQPLWLMEPKEITDEQHLQFYRYIANSFDTPRFKIHFKTDVPVSIRAVLYFPEGKPGLFEMSRDTETGVALYTRKILIQSKTELMLPKWLRFVKGVVDSEDIPLNLSRELLQNSSLIRKIQSVLTSRVLKFLYEKSTKEPENYEKFYKDYGLFLKEGIVTTHDQKEKEDIGKLLRFETNKTGDNVKIGLDDYLKHLKENQKDIYYLAAPSRQLALNSPYFESLKKNDYEVLFCYEPYDELVLMQLISFKNHNLVSVEKEIRRATSTEESDKLFEENLSKPTDSLSKKDTDDLIRYLRKELGNKVQTVKYTTKLDQHPCVITVEDMASARHFIKTQSHQLSEDNRYALLQSHLEINPKHPIIMKLHKLLSTDEKLASLLAQQLFSNALTIAGLVEDPRLLLTQMNELLIKVLEKH
ncbi:CLUMA_CG014905, isoform A [Clunio marinus]|uniref:Heat shock protein 75 kDa, mitochondrial n=1 Tax=Clunio marinus TaxID=568069 RepID=A0A1J1IRI1_9DIPT|nr:CLUMA_CG014905, isoform A [Clunio marinus]